MSASWLSERANVKRHSNGFELLGELQASLITRRWSVSQEPLEPHLGNQNRSKNQASKGSTTYTLWNRFRTALDADFGPFGPTWGPCWGQVGLMFGQKRGTQLGGPLFYVAYESSCPPLGALLEPSWGPLGGLLEAVLGRFGAVMGLTLGLCTRF